MKKKYAAYLSQELRLAGFVVDTEYTSRSLKAQFKQADRLKAKYIAVLNDEDLDNHEIKIKNNQTKEEEVISLDAIIYYLDEKLVDEMEDDCGCSDCSTHDHECECGENCHCHDD